MTSATVAFAATVLREEQRRVRLERTHAAIRRLEDERSARGLCRHCGGPVPCWSAFGDAAVGVRHTQRTLNAHRGRP